MKKIDFDKVNLKDVRICKECKVLFVPKEPWFHTCPHCFNEGDNDCCDACIEDTF